MYTIDIRSSREAIRYLRGDLMGRMPGNQIKAISESFNELIPLHHSLRIVHRSMKNIADNLSKVIR